MAERNPDLRNPLGPEQRKKLNEMIDRTQDGLEATKRARSAGLNVDGMEERLRQDLNRLLSLKQVYFPGEQ